MNPLEFYGLHMETLVGLTVESKPSGHDISVFGSQRTITDPFQKLSNELICHVTEYMESKEVFALRQASMVIREATSGDSFWIPRVQKDMAWLWIPLDLFRDAGHHTGGTDNPRVDWMKVYLLFDRSEEAVQVDMQKVEAVGLIWGQHRESLANIIFALCSTSAWVSAADSVRQRTLDPSAAKKDVQRIGS